MLEDEAGQCVWKVMLVENARRGGWTVRLESNAGRKC